MKRRIVHDKFCVNHVKSSVENIGRGYWCFSRGGRGGGGEAVGVELGYQCSECLLSLAKHQNTFYGHVLFFSLYSSLPWLPSPQNGITCKLCCHLSAPSFMHILLLLFLPCIGNHDTEAYFTCRFSQVNCCQVVYEQSRPLDYHETDFGFEFYLY